MGPTFLFFFVIATEPLLLSAVQPSHLNYPTANPSKIWNSRGAYIDGNPSMRRPILTCPLQPDATNSISLVFAVGFLCDYSTPGDKFLFGVSIVSVNGGRSITNNHQQVVWSANQARPVSENATLEFTSDRNLVLCDADSSQAGQATAQANLYLACASQRWAIWCCLITGMQFCGSHLIILLIHWSLGSHLRKV
jgi:hypothetical protein